MTQAISLGQQMDALALALTQTQNAPLKGQRLSVKEFQITRLQAAHATLAWLHNHEAEIRAFLSLPVETRAAVLRRDRLCDRKEP